jgi:predicted nucleic acid-binding protein
MIVIADSSALVALSLCQSLPLLETLFGEVYVPLSVYKEVTFKGKPEAEALGDYLQARVKPVDMENHPIQNTTNLGSGELEAIALYMDIDADLLIIDDARAKKAAYENGLEVMGSIGALLLAKERGLITEIRSLLNLLNASDIHLSSRIINKALELAGE